MITKQWHRYCFYLSPPLMFALSLPASPNTLAGAAAAVYLFSRSDRQQGRALVAAAVLILISIWLPLPVACLLTGMVAVEAIFADSWRRRITRGAALILGVCIIVFTLNHRIAPSQMPIDYSPIAFLLTAIALCDSTRHRATLDPLLCALLSLLLLSFALSIKITAAALGDYRHALVLVALAYCAALAAIVLLVAPLFRGGGGLSNFSHAFSFEIPVDKWIADISTLAQKEDKPDDFLAAAAHRLMSLPGISGIGWQAANNPPQHIGKGARFMAINCPPVEFTIYYRRLISPWTRFNYYLLCRVISEYYTEHRREETQRAQNILRAVHQAGARITHDIKNILHVLLLLSSSKDDATIRRQLPLLQHRLKHALDKLRGMPATSTAQTPANIWWAEARQQYEHTTVIFNDTQATTLILPLLFDRALDNFLENAMKKYAASPLAIHASLESSDNGVALRVSDNGSPIDKTIAADIFIRPVSSESGFGIALCQLAQEAKTHGYRAHIAANDPKNVVFALTPAADIK